MITRRTALLGAAGAFGAAGTGAALWDGALPGEYQARRVLGLTGPDGAVPAPGPVTVTTRRLHSAARNRDITVITMVPDGIPPSRLPVCLLLPGRDNVAPMMVTLGLPQFLAAAVAAGDPPFAVVTVDAGHTYWVEQTPGDDPQAMLRSELPRWLTSFGLAAHDGTPTSVLGISAGCYGALNYARARARATGDIPAVAVLSPALFPTWNDTLASHAFDSVAVWSATEPLLHPTPLPRLGVWCGQEDPFYPAARQLVTQQHPALARLSPGAHTPGYWRRVLPEALRFLAAPPGP
ncbi:alpha/beta hydrolase [Pseudonocardia spinosispora]|uniref:alpha/beta hydrolase n=1 Tax=Pseudonocardia spinosispora TaxID=103441 RepID=UPI000415C5EB|nr:alpha/beta hydrolase-fold protein [Pseudonocardia spinosispora]